MRAAEAGGAESRDVLLESVTGAERPRHAVSETAAFAYFVGMVDRDDFRLASPVLSVGDQRVAVAWKGVS